MFKSFHIKRIVGIVLLVAVLASSMFVYTLINAEEVDEMHKLCDYSALENKSALFIDDYYTTLGMYDGAGLNIKSGALSVDAKWLAELNLDNDVDKSGAYAVYKTDSAKDFTAVFSKDTNLAHFTLFVSTDGVSWDSAETVADGENKRITVPAKGDGERLVKIVFVNGDNGAAATDALVKADFHLPKKNDAELRFDYGAPAPNRLCNIGNGVTDANAYVTAGVWQSGGNMMWFTSGIVQSDWQTLDNARTPDSYDGFVTYKVQPKTRFSLTVTENRGVSTIAEKLGYVNKLDWGVEFYGSADNKNFERLQVQYLSGARYQNGKSDTPLRSMDYNFIVPDGVVYVKCKMPMTQNLSTTDPQVWPYAGNDLFAINKVEFTRLTYDYLKLGEKDYYIETEFNNENLADFGMESISGETSRKTNGLLDSTFNAQYYNKGTTFVYSVEPGTGFYAGFKVIYGPNITNYGPSGSYQIKLVGYDPTECEWKEAAAVTPVLVNGNYEPFYSVGIKPEDNTYSKIRIEWPRKKNDGYPGQDALGLAEVALTHPLPDTRPVFDYTDLNAYPMDENGIGIKMDPNVALERLGIYKMAPNPLENTSCSLCRSNSDFNKGALWPSWEIVYHRNQGEVQFYVDYEVTGGTKFSANVTINNDPVWGKPDWESRACYQGKKFELKFLTSADGTTWKEAYATGDKSGKLFIDIAVPQGDTYVRILFPHDGNPNGREKDGRVYNDMMYIESVRYIPGESGLYEKYIDYDAIGENKLDFVDSVYEDLLIYDSKGVSVNKYANNACYLGTTDSYVKNGAASVRPYVTYKVKPNTPTKLAVTRNVQKCASMGKDFNVSIYESADGKNWTKLNIAPITAQGAGIDVYDTYKFTTSGKCGFIKVEFPHKTIVNGATGAQDIGIAGFGFTPAEYGEYKLPGKALKFGKTLNYADANAFPSNEMLSPVFFPIYSVFSAGVSRTWHQPGVGMAPNWDYLNGRTKLDEPDVIFNVVPGTAFQAQFTFGAGALSAVEKALGRSYLPKLLISENGSEWKEYCDSSVKLLNSKLRAGRAELILTINSVPNGYKFVKAQFPMTGDVSLLTDGAFPYAGNDIMELAVVSFTQGTAEESEFQEEKTDEPEFIFLPPNNQRVKIIKKPLEEKAEVTADHTWIYIVSAAGGVVLLGIAAFLIFFLKKRKKKKI